MEGPRSAFWIPGFCALAISGAACSTDDPIPPPPPPPLTSDALTTLFLLTPRAELDAFALEAPLSHKELADLYGASDEAIARLNSFGVTHGFSANVVSTRTIGMAMLSPEVAEVIFEVKLQYSEIPTLKSTVIGVGSTIEIPHELDGFVEAIVVGAQTSLSTLAFREGVRSTMPAYKELDPTQEELCKPGLDPEQGHSADAYRTAFGLDDVGVTGKDRHVAVIELTETILGSDFDVFGECQGITNMPSIPVVSANVTGQRLGVESLPVLAEAQMDVQAVLTVAPELESIPVSIASSAEDAWGPTVEFPVALAKAIDPTSTGGDVPDAVSVSYGDCEPFLESKFPGLIEVSEALMAKAFALGVVVVVATGDTGSSGCLYLQDGTYTQAVGYPASSPYALAVGGSNLPLNDDGSISVSELAVWNGWEQTDEAGCDGTQPVPCRPAASDAGAGGPSGKGLEGWAGLDAPPWQKAAGVDADGKRVVPDLSLPADAADGLVIYCTAVANGIVASCQSRENAPPEHAWFPGGGTSLSAPLMAAAIALMKEKAVAAGEEPPFPLAEWLYEQAGDDQSKYFYDIVNGDNIVGDQTSKFPVDCCDAEAGFDLATGWGMPKLSTLINAAATP